LQGTGVVSGTVTVTNGGTVGPGGSPGILTVTNFDLQSGGILLIEIDGLAAGTEYDQLVVTGTTALAGDLTVAGSYSPEIFETFTIIDASSPVAGQFSQGTELVSGAGKFLIDYAAGPDGFDVVLTRVPEPGTLAVALVGLIAALRRRRS
jgi:hypothetical protein